ncbi:aspartyl protease APCB1-like [Musa acuminata AAA Group]|uniref:aspartyl protease APCB1-like n=1 Tax=Musa acuminata AAA Group TaxID=214697 RepID=UPI0031D3D0B6
MERETERPPPPQLHGVVIISLPPPDNPFKGKTITAFTLSDDAPPPPPHVPPAARSPLARAARRSLLSPRSAAATVLGASLLLFSLWICLFSEAPMQLLDEPSREEDGRRQEEERSFLFPLYPKSGGRALREVGGVKLGSISRKRKQSGKLETYASANSSTVLPIGGNLFPDGQYYTTLLVGSSPRPYYLDVDTGSDLTWIQCDAPCASCAKGPHPLYKPRKGNLVLPKDSLCLEVQKNQNNHYCDSCHQCDYEIEYADHSSSMGVLATDEMHLIAANGDRAKLNFVFGCAYDQQGQLLVSPAKTDGILGLSSSRISLASQLESQGIISNVIGHCIKRDADGGGYLFLGDDYVPRWGMTLIPRQNDLTNFYRAKVLKINYGGKQVIGGKRGYAIPVIFDTGSSYTYFPVEAYRKLITSLKTISNIFVQDSSDLTMPICWRANFPVRSFKDVKHFFQPLTLQFEKRWWIMSRSFTIPPEGYLMISNKGNVCLGILNGTEVHDGSTIILGDISLRGKLIVYDNVQRTIGWTHSDCNNPQKATGFPFFF